MRHSPQKAKGVEEGMAQSVTQHDTWRRPSQKTCHTGACAGIVIALLSFSVRAVAATSGTPLPALFTDVEAAQGRIVFEQHCAICHGEDLRGEVGPAVIGPSFGSVADHTTVSIMFNVIAAEMPAGNPASLTHEEYTDVMAYVLQRNGYPAGAHPLSFTSAQTLDVPLISQVR
jgi:mono/diheme cytochrome c family protein